MTSQVSGQWSEFEPYAQLVSALLPRASGISVFDAGGERRWTSEESIDPQLAPLLRQSVAESASKSNEAGTRVQLPGDVPAYVFWLRDERQVLVALLAIHWRGAETEQRTFSYVNSMAGPVVECLRREIAARARLASASATGTGNGRDRDLDVLLLATADAEAADGGDGIKGLLQKATDHLQCEFAALIVPGRNLVQVAKAAGRSVDTSALVKIHKQLVSLAQVRSEPVIFNSAADLPGVKLQARVLMCPIRNAAGRSSGVLALFRTLSHPEFRERDAQLADLMSRRASAMVEASFDTLSGLLTRATFEQRARALLAARGDKKKSWCSLYIDTDRMHVINDNYGMLVGDKLLAKLGELIRSRLVPGALASRISGDRFAILLPTESEDAMNFAEGLRQGVASLTAAHLGANADASFSASVSIGVAAIAESATEFAHTFAVAETSCKAAKDRGRNRVELYQASDVSIMRRYEDINIAPSLRAAITENRLRLDAQLIVPLPSALDVVPHYELLLRMIDDNGEAVGPARFMSAAVRYQLMPAVDRWVIRQAISLLTPHRVLLADRPVVFTINISGQSLGDPDFVDFIIGLIQEAGLNPRVLCFELTESAAIGNLPKAEIMMRRLRELGCSIALDDFGTGLSSLAYLRALPVDMLKIDGSFVRDILKDPRAESMVQAIAQLARSMNLVTVAEYVETEEIRLRVAALGVDYGQGFAIARPVVFDEVIAQLPMYSSGTLADLTALDLGPNDATIAATFVEVDDDDSRLDDNTQARLKRLEIVLSTYDHSESPLYQARGGSR